MCYWKKILKIQKILNETIKFFNCFPDYSKVLNIFWVPRKTITASHSSQNFWNHPVLLQGTLLLGPPCVLFPGLIFSGVDLAESSAITISFPVQSVLKKKKKVIYNTGRKTLVFCNQTEYLYKVIISLVHNLHFRNSVVWLEMTWMKSALMCIECSILESCGICLTD